MATYATRLEGSGEVSDQAHGVTDGWDLAATNYPPENHFRPQINTVMARFDPRLFHAYSGSERRTH